MMECIDAASKSIQHVVPGCNVGDLLASSVAGAWASHSTPYPGTAEWVERRANWRYDAAISVPIRLGSLRFLYRVG
jgi:hypothetical protein